MSLGEQKHPWLRTLVLEVYSKEAEVSEKASRKSEMVSCRLVIARVRCGYTREKHFGRKQYEQMLEADLERVGRPVRQAGREVQWTVANAWGQALGNPDSELSKESRVAAFTST